MQGPLGALRRQLNQLQQPQADLGGYGRSDSTGPHTLKLLQATGSTTHLLPPAVKSRGHRVSGGYISPVCNFTNLYLSPGAVGLQLHATRNKHGICCSLYSLTLTAYQQADAAYHLSAMCLLPHSCGLSAHLLPNVCCPMGKIDHRLCYITCHLLSILLAAQHLLPWWAAQHLPQSTPESKQCHLQD